MRKPRLTKKVLDGLNAALSAVEAGDQLSHGGELESDSDKIAAAYRWLIAMYAYRNQAKDPVALPPGGTA